VSQFDNYSIWRSFPVNSKPFLLLKFPLRFYFLELHLCTYFEFFHASLCHTTLNAEVLLLISVALLQAIGYMVTYAVIT
jgi:hypothetical protein